MSNLDTPQTPAASMRATARDKRKAERLARRVARAQWRVVAAQTKLASARYEQHEHIHAMELEADVLDMTARAYGS